VKRSARSRRFFVDWVAPPAPEAPAPPPPPPKPEPRPRIKPIPPVGAAAPAPAPVTPAFVAPPPEPEPVVVEAPVPAAPMAPPAPPASPPPPAPKTLSVTAVEYLAPPQLAYPPLSRRLGEQGTVHVRVLVDARGAPAQAVLLRSSGHARLDAAAMDTVQATRFKPHTENGIPLPFWVVMPFAFELDQ
jgi:protein TonB